MSRGKILVQLATAAKKIDAKEEGEMKIFVFVDN